MIRYILLFAILLSSSMSFSQDSDVQYERQGDLIHASYYDDQGNLEQHGTFNLNGELHGIWISYDVAGNKLVEARYDRGKKAGKWLYFNNEMVKEVIYENSRIVSVNEIKDTKTRVAIRN